MAAEAIGVGIVVLDKEKQSVLLGLRINSYNAGEYGCPGGRVNENESLEDAASRELLEETGLKGSLRCIGVIREWQIDHSFIHFMFLCDDLGDQEPKNMEPEKCGGWEWFPMDKMPENILIAHKTALEFLKNPTSENIKEINF